MFDVIKTVFNKDSHMAKSMLNFLEIFLTLNKATKKKNQQKYE
jgi:hypothetical protein